MELSPLPPLGLGSHRQQERSFPAAVLMATGPPSPLVLPSDQAAPSPSPRRHKENSESLDPTPLPSHGDPWHRWSGEYEAHLWDSSCRVEGCTRKGK
ncbi:hypothetical protein PVAP13_7NG340800 [Panicum virgatum]|uniref:Uncharacterized protein n=1 Tax=Panicum virgatum TaxID=38727 RepID=A0A8T0PYK1_PANVG|nr:hypothetical protein PVAP13_7NG340800 [Panicum virgatum]